MSGLVPEMTSESYAMQCFPLYSLLLATGKSRSHKGHNHENRVARVVVKKGTIMRTVAKVVIIKGTIMRTINTMDQISIKTPNPKCRLYWCLIECYRLEIQSVILLIFLNSLMN
jgi:hypothetical protein